jgi:hypothetical protein
MRPEFIFLDISQAVINKLFCVDQIGDLDIISLLFIIIILLVVLENIGGVKLPRDYLLRIEGAQASSLFILFTLFFRFSGAFHPIVPKQSLQLSSNVD